jgi:diguanylate cyclase (GGDEF)-like protein
MSLTGRGGQGRIPPRAPLEPSSVESSRGTLVAIAFSATALLLVLAWARRHGLETGLSPLELLAVLLVPTLAGRVVVVLAPRAAWTPATPLVLAAGLLAGPLVGACAGAVTQLLTVGKTWRYRLTWGGIAALQGFAAGLAGQLPWAGADGAVVRTAVAILLVFALNQGANALVALERRIEPALPHALLCLRVDLIEAFIAFPLLAIFLIGFGSAPLPAIGLLAAALTLVSLADHSRRRMLAELASERLRARRDPLTDAPNRLALDEALRSEHGRVLRGSRPAGVVFVDVDLFKAVNDGHGYEVGDALLVSVYERLRERLRPSDFIARWGGEEFVVLASEIGDEASLRRFAERVRCLFTEEPLAANWLNLRVTVSVGGTLLDGSMPRQQVLDFAGALVKRAKSKRNTSVVELIPRRRPEIGGSSAASPAA